MAIEIRCPSCGKRLRLADQWAGRMCKCPGCQMTIEVPDTAAMVSASQEANPPPTYRSKRPARREPAARAPGRRTRQSSSAFVDYLLFRRMITPIAIRVIFWIFFAGFIVEGVSIIAAELAKTFF